ncbi:MAG: YdcF family protein [Oscillospiraceae bacterium]|nr:YdcF family protein [Oscillospiraceae bacterium]
MRKKIIGIILLSAAVLTLICIISVGISISSYAKTDETQKADAAIILGAAVEDGAPTPVFRERINHGISLYQDGYVEYLIFTGGIGDGDSISEAQAGKNYAISMGIPQSAILIEEESHITEENLENAKALMEQNDLQTALIVSDPLHMKRAMLMAKDYGITAYASPTKTTMYQSAKTKLPFLAREIVMYIGYGFVRIFQ